MTPARIKHFESLSFDDIKSLTADDFLVSEIEELIADTPLRDDDKRLCVDFFIKKKTNQEVADKHCVSTQASGSTLPVAIQVGSITYPVLDRYGNPMQGSVLKTNSTGKFYCSRLNYLTYYGSSSPHFIAHNFPKVSCSYYGS